MERPSGLPWASFIAVDARTSDVAASKNNARLSKTGFSLAGTKTP